MSREFPTAVELLDVRKAFGPETQNYLPSLYEKREQV